MNLKMNYMISNPNNNNNEVVISTPTIIDDCRDYIRTGKCKYGDQCKYNHPIGRIPLSSGGVSGSGGQTCSIINNTMIIKNHNEPIFPIRPTEPSCSYYLRYGTCKFGQICKFHHPPKHQTSAHYNNNSVDVDKFQPYAISLPQRPTEPDCPFYVRNGHCKFGASCKFHHPLPLRLRLPSASDNHSLSSTISVNNTLVKMPSSPQPQPSNTVLCIPCIPLPQHHHQHQSSLASLPKMVESSSRQSHHVISPTNYNNHMPSSSYHNETNMHADMHYVQQRSFHHAQPSLSPPPSHQQLNTNIRYSNLQPNNKPYYAINNNNSIIPNNPSYSNCYDIRKNTTITANDHIYHTEKNQDHDDNNNYYICQQKQYYQYQQQTRDDDYYEDTDILSKKMTSSLLFNE